MSGDVVAATLVAPAPPPWRRWVLELWWVLNTADTLTLATLLAIVRTAASIPRIARLPLAAVALVAFMAYKATVGYLADSRPIGAVLLAPFVVVAGVSLFCAWAMSGLAPIRISGGHGHYTTVRSTVTGRTKITAHYVGAHTDKMTATHEGGHAAAAANTPGGRPLEARAYSWGGWCSAILPRSGSLKERVIRYGAFIAGGEVSVHSRSGCGHDQDMIRWALGKLPQEERAAARHEMYRRARVAQILQYGVQQAVARSLLSTGKWGGGGSGSYGI